MVRFIPEAATAEQTNQAPILLPMQLPPEKQRSIAEELDRTPGEVLKKLEDIRNKLL